MYTVHKYFVLFTLHSTLQCGRITSRNGQKYHIMTLSEWHKIENDGDPWQPTCWLQMAHNDDETLPINTKLYTNPAGLQHTHNCTAPTYHRTTFSAPTQLYPVLRNTTQGFIILHHSTPYLTPSIWSTTETQSQSRGTDFISIQITIQSAWHPSYGTIPWPTMHPFEQYITRAHMHLTRPMPIT